MKAELLADLLADRAARRPVVVLTHLDDGDQRRVHDETELEDATLRAAFCEARATDRARIVETEAGERIFVHPYNPPLHLAIVGAVHIAQHLAELARRTGYAVTVIDPRTPFASSERFPDVALSHEWPDAALNGLELDARCAVVTLSHDPKFDDPALETALRSNCFYIGALGSRRTQERRRERMRALGFGDDALARIHGPVGLDIGARSPAEIALSIAAEITTTLRRPR